MNMNATTDVDVTTLTHDVTTEVAVSVKPYEDDGVNELIYVVVVIVFYAAALMVMLGTQVSQGRRVGVNDMDYHEYYDEYLQRRDKLDKERMIQKLNVMRMQLVVAEETSADLAAAESV